MSIVITGATRTPMGALGGQFKTTPASTLGATAIKAAIENSHCSCDAVDEVIMGCVLQAGQGQAPARQAALLAGLPTSTGAVTINKMCGSGLKAIQMAHDSLVANSHDIIVAGGMESMSNAPYLLKDERFGKRLGHGKVLDHMFIDGLEDAYEKGKLMGVFADQCANHFNITRNTQDTFALTSLQRTKEAMAAGDFNTEITPVTVSSRQGDTVHLEDEPPLSAKPEKIPLLKPAFGPEGTVTAANASSIADGASACVLMREETAKQIEAPILARIVAHTQHAQAPEWFSTAPIGAIEKLLNKTGWSLDEVDLFEINEAFAVVTIAAMQHFNLPADKVNIAGGACALGHPIGASGARILVTLIHALKRLGKKRGIASLCIGGGEAVAMAIEV